MILHDNSDALEGYDVDICVGARDSENARLQNTDDACYDFTGGGPVD